MRDTNRAVRRDSRRMKSFAPELTVAACLALASACSDNAKDPSLQPEPAIASPSRSPSDDAAPASTSEPITVDKGDGCVVVIQAEGHGPAARIGDEVTLDYVARLSDTETPFASTSSWIEPCRVVLGNVAGPRVVPGLVRGLEGLKEGAKATITVPPALAYGKAGLPSAGIPADATLVFEVHLSGVRR